MWNQGNPEKTELLAKQQTSWASFQNFHLDRPERRKEKGKEIILPEDG